MGSMTISWQLRGFRAYNYGMYYVAWMLEKGEIRVNLEWTFVLFTHFGSLRNSEWSLRLLICAIQPRYFPMKFHTHHQKVISNHKPHSKIVYYVTCRKCMTLNFQLIFIIYPYLVLIEVWRIEIFIRMESVEPPEDDYVRNLQRKHLS